MLTFEDCLDYCELTLDEIDAVAAQQHSDRLQALALAGSLVQSEEGRRQMARLLAMAMLNARVTGHVHEARELEGVLENFCTRYQLPTAS